MAQIKETHVVETTPTTSTQVTKVKGSRATPWLAFFAGALLIAVIALFFMNASGHYTGPAGNLDLNVQSPVSTPVTPNR